MIRFLFRWIGRLIALFLLSTVFMTLVYRYVPVYITPLMVIRGIAQLGAGEKVTFHHAWVPLNRISKSLPQAVVASEDNRFMQHNGFDLEAIKQAAKENETRKRPRGASTISQQTAKNVFLWPQSSWVRKGLEVYFTFLIETFWSKARIMEVYLNSIEMGNGIYGAEAVAKYHFHTTAKQLSPAQCALIAATLPNPIRFNSAKPSPYMLRRQRQILSLMGKIGTVSFDK